MRLEGGSEVSPAGDTRESTSPATGSPREEDRGCWLTDYQASLRVTPRDTDSESVLHQLQTIE